MPIEVFEKKACKTESGESLIALQHVLKKYGITVEYKGGSYSPEEYTAKFVFSVPRSDGIPTSFAAACGKFGLSVEDYGKRFHNSQGTAVYKLVGIKPRNRKYPIIGLRSDGQRFKFGPQVLKGLF